MENIESSASLPLGSSENRIQQWVILALLVLLLAAHHTWVLQHLEPAYSSPDASGYFVQARMLATEGRSWFRPDSPLQYIGIHWLEAPDGRFFSRYPTGYPLLLAVPFRLIGPTAPLYVNPILATLTLLFLFLLCRPWIGQWLALVAVLIFAVNPTANRHALHADSHTAVTAFLLAGLLVLERWSRNPSRTKAVLSGLMLGMIPTIRYAESLVALGIVIFLVIQLRNHREIRHTLPFLLLSAAIPCILLLLRNQYAFGAFWRTGYSLTGEQTGFGLEYMAQKAGLYVVELMSRGAGLFFAFGLVGLMGMIRKKDTRPLALLLTGVIIPITLIYMAYYWGGPGIRFLLPTLPLYILPALWLFREIHSPGVAKAGLATLVVFHLAIGVPLSEEQMEGEQERAARTSAVVTWVDNHVPEESLIIADRRLHETLDYYGRWRLVDALFLARGRVPQGPMRALEGQPSPRQDGKAQSLRASYQELSRQERTQRITQDLLDWAGGKTPVYWIGRALEVNSFSDNLPEGFRFNKVGEIEVPALEQRRRTRLGTALGNSRARMREYMRNLLPGGARQVPLSPFNLQDDGRPIDVYLLERDGPDYQ